MSSVPALAMIIVAAGRGARFGGDVPKQFRMLGDKPVLAHTLARARLGGHVGSLITVIHPQNEARYNEAAAASGADAAQLSVCHGGATRQDSVRSGLETLDAAGFPADGIALIHDAARPFLSETVLLRAALAAAQHGAAIPVLPMADTLATFDGAGHPSSNPDRAALRAVQAPQAFRFALIPDAHFKAAAEGDPISPMMPASHVPTALPFTPLQVILICSRSPLRPI